ncbi:hypothetical protein BaRGS_00002123, partial [Batillaria attramentaria]
LRASGDSYTTESLTVVEVLAWTFPKPQLCRITDIGCVESVYVAGRTKLWWHWTFACEVGRRVL